MREEPLSDIDYPEEFIPIAAELQRLPYLAPSAKFADRVISRIDRLQQSGTVFAQPKFEVIRGGAIERVAGSTHMQPRRRQMVALAVGVPVAAAMVIAVSIIFAQLDVLAAILTASATQASGVIGVIGSAAGGMVLGEPAMLTLEAGSAQAALLYLVMAAGLIAGYSGIKVAAEIAKRKAA